MRKPRIAFAGDRDISVWVLEHILKQGIRPLALLVPEEDMASHDDTLISLCSFLDPERVLKGYRFRQSESISLLKNLNLDYILCVHFPYILPIEILSIPKIGVLNLHPAYLPYNRGWHTPSWAILEETPAGATLHFMDTGVDTGDIIWQKSLEVSLGDTANTLYQRLKRLEMQVFEEAWPCLVSKQFQRETQDPNQGSQHKRKDLFQEHVQKIDLDQPIKGGDLIQRLRALTTNRIEEAAYYEVGTRRFRIQVIIHEEAGTDR